MTTNICHHFGLPKDEEEFNWRFKALGIRNPACRDCQHVFNKDYYEGDAKERHLQKVKERTEAARDYVHQYLLPHPCEICGAADPIVLEFHHIREKDMTVIKMVSGASSIKRGSPVSGGKKPKHEGHHTAPVGWRRGVHKGVKSIDFTGFFPS